MHGPVNIRYTNNHLQTSPAKKWSRNSYVGHQLVLQFTTEISVVTICTICNNIKKLEYSTLTFHITLETNTDYRLSN